MVRTRASLFLPRRIASWLVLLALLVRGLIPVGFMPEVGALRHGVYAITVCSGSAQKNVIVDRDGNVVDPAGQGAPASGHPDDGPCLFALSLQVAALVLLAVALVLLASERSPWRLPAGLHTPFERPPGTPGARAPPAWS